MYLLDLTLPKHGPVVELDCSKVLQMTLIALGKSFGSRTAVQVFLYFEDVNTIAVRLIYDAESDIVRHPQILEVHELEVDITPTALGPLAQPIVYKTLEEGCVGRGPWNIQTNS